MNGTEDTRKPEEADPTLRREDVARVRARAYLDLWERHLVQSAAEAPVAAWTKAPR